MDYKKIIVAVVLAVGSLISNISNAETLDDTQIAMLDSFSLHCKQSYTLHQFDLLETNRMRVRVWSVPTGSKYIKINMLDAEVDPTNGTVIKVNNNDLGVSDQQAVNVQRTIYISRTCRL
jgi:hypothetical protein